MGEFELIARLAPFLRGAGDDAAVLRIGGRSVCVAVDVVVEDVHFRRDLSTLTDVGWKAVAVNVSDLAAMGAVPTAAVVGLLRPADMSQDDVVELYEGMAAAAEEWGLDLAGGDTVAARQLAVSVTVLGEAERPVPRDGARPGDRVVVVGALGAGATALAQVRAGRPPEPALLAAHRRPRALVAAGRVLAARGATAMIDVSDGLGRDLAHICAASGVAMRLDAAALPVAEGVDGWEVAVGGGEDFALAACVPAEMAEEATSVAGAADAVPAGVVGEVVDGAPRVTLRLPDGSVHDVSRFGFDHYEDR